MPVVCIFHEEEDSGYLKMQILFLQSKIMLTQVPLICILLLPQSLQEMSVSLIFQRTLSTSHGNNQLSMEEARLQATLLRDETFRMADGPRPASPMLLRLNSSSLA